MDKAYLKKTGLQVLSAALTALMLVYLVFHLFSSSVGAVETTLVKNTIGERTLTLDGYIFRAETVLASSYTGTKSYTYDDGTKVAQGTAVATAYANDTNRGICETIEQIEEKIALLEVAQRAASLSSNDTARIENEIYDLLISIKQHVLTGDLAYAASSEGALLLALCEKQLLLYSNSDFNADIATLKSELLRVRSMLSGASATVYADRDGYFYSVVDGGEGIFTSSSVDALTPSVLDGMIERWRAMDAPAGAVGKIVTEFNWYVAAKVDTDALASFTAGKSYTLIFPSSSDTRLNAKLVRTVTEAGRDDALVIFSLTSVPTGFDFSRSQSVRVVTNAVSGLAVPMSAVKYEDGHAYVYILRGGVVLRRSVDILDRFNGYFYVSSSSESVTVGEVTYSPLSDSEYVITHGRKLYHNKVIS